MSAKAGKRKRKVKSSKKSPLRRIVKGATRVVGGIKDYSAGISTTASRKIRGLVREFNDAIPALESLGFSITKFSVELSIAPDIGATLIGSVKALNPKKIRTMINKRSRNKPLKVMLHALLISANTLDDLQGLGIRGIEINITLGFPTVVNVDLMVK